MLHHIFANLITRLPMLGLTFIMAFAIEWVLPIDAMISARGMLLNCIVGLCFLFVQEFSYLALAFFVVHPRPGLISLAALSDGGNIIKGFGFAFFWLAARDFFYYWLHRLQHASKWLWAEHALHHSDEHVNVTTSLRHHWLEMPITIILVNVPLILLFRPPVVTLAFVGGILSLTEFSNHMNFKFGLGRWSWLLATPQTHRIHHSRLDEHLDKNFAAFLPLWDVIFGTYYAPKKNEYPPTGLASGERVTTVRQALFLPFLIWQRMLFGTSSRES